MFFFFLLFFSPVIVAIYHLLNALSINGLDVTCECVRRGCTQPAALQCHVSSPFTIPELRALFMPLCAAVMLRGFQHFFLRQKSKQSVASPGPCWSLSVCYRIGLVAKPPPPPLSLYSTLCRSSMTTSAI